MPVTVNQLIRDLQDQVKASKSFGSRKVMLARDPEGNGFRPLADVYLGKETGEGHSNVAVLWPE